MEVYFTAMAFYSCLPEFKSLANCAMEEAPSPLISYLYKVFDFRLQRGLSQPGSVSEISTIRDKFQQFLYTVKAVQGPEGSYQSAFVRVFSIHDSEFISQIMWIIRAGYSIY